MSDYPKRAVQWDPKRANKMAAGKPIEGEYVGKFRTRVEPGALNSVNFKGTLGDGRTYDYWGIDVDQVSGVLRWIDKQETDFGTKLNVFLENDKFLHLIKIDYDVTELRNIINRLIGLKDALTTQVLHFGYWVRKKTDASGKVKVNDKGKVMWAETITLTDTVPYIEKWLDFSQQKGLDWVQKKDAKGNKYYDQSAEFKFWDSYLVRIQKMLLKTPTVFPSTYNSLTACEAENPSGGGNLSSEEIQLAKDIYERRKNDFVWSYSRRQVNADSAFEAAPVFGDVQQGQNQTSISQDHNFPDEPISLEMQEDTAPPLVTDDLPF